MNNINLDLNLLLVADSLFRTLSATKTAKEMGLSQSAISHSLARLRVNFGDPLFVRVPKGLAPTQFALEIKNQIEDIVAKGKNLYTRKNEFNPKTAKGRIIISTTDYFEIVVMPKLLKVLREEAPLVQISLRPTLGELPVRELESGVFDLAIAGFYNDLPQGYYQTSLFQDTFSTAWNKKLTKSQNKITINDFYLSDHALITLQGDFKDGLEQKIDGKKYSRNIVYGSHSFTGLAWVLSSSSLYLTGPTLLLKAYQKYFPLTVVDCPIELKRIKIQAVWHSLTNQDPLQKWFREKLKIICSEL